MNRQLSVPGTPFSGADEYNNEFFTQPRHYEHGRPGDKHYELRNYSALCRVCLTTGAQESCIVFSPGFGAGFSTWAHGYFPWHRDAVSIRQLARWMQKTEPGDGRVDVAKRNRQFELLTKWFDKRAAAMGEDGPCLLGVEVRQLHFAWLPIGEPFRIDEYDGSESLITREWLYETA